ncbi:MAG: AraC family transcriptional regulator [Rhizomicrobium sp.]|nr:AraC family transcriptional regulator [Rhizomicrobium sp.]
MSDVLRFVQLSGERVLTSELRSGFNVAFEQGAACIHVVQEGALRITVEGRPPLQLYAGDIVVLPHPARYRLSDDGALQAPLSITASDAVIAVLEHGQGAIVAKTISATFQFENKGGVSPLLRLLPEVIHIAKDADQSAVLIRDVAQFLIIEQTTQEPGAALMISRVIDVLIIRCIRTWAKSRGPRQGWIGALADARVSKAVAAIHRQPARNWTVETLASVAGMSRSRFAELFLATVGEPPLRYLHRWRLAMAFDLLRNSNLPVGEVAHTIGYESEAAFSRAYKTMYGTPPRDDRLASSR